jgi:hypothetical protein
MAKEYSGKEVRSMLEALGDRANEIITLAERAQAEVASATFGPYFHFRDKVQEFEAFTIIVNQRVVNVKKIEDENYMSRFNDCVGNHFKTLVAGSLHFLFALSANTTLPLGSKEVFLSELRTLHNTREKLRAEKYAHLIDENTQNDLETAEEILTEIIDKAPSLLSFGQL